MVSTADGGGACAGFLFGYIYGNRERGYKLDFYDFMCKRWAGLYPLYVFSIFVGEFFTMSASVWIAAADGHQMTWCDIPKLCLSSEVQ
jgi:peptidoglycan/LPS O-acetylase OafA/YrhL